MFSRAKRLPTVYLAGAIRDGHHEDIAWRERVITALGDLAVFLNPLAGKRYDPSTRMWTKCGIPSAARLIVAHDFWSIDHADVILFNLHALQEGYPNIGTLIEFGRATARKCLIYVILGTGYTGHASEMFQLHPFLEENSAIIFPTVEEAITYLRSGGLTTLSGETPHYADA